MANANMTVTIVGTDNHAPIVADYPYWKAWGKHEIYFGQEGYNKFIPKVNDFVVDIETGDEFVVISIDPTTYVPHLRKRKLKSLSDEIPEEEGLFFAGGNLALPCTRQIFYDDSNVRPTLCVPAQLSLRGTMHHHAIAYRGTSAGEGGKAISVRYDGNFNPISQSIPLEAINSDRSEWKVPSFYSTEKLVPGEMILLKLYDDRGGFTGRANFFVEPSALLRDVGDADKFISAISLESIFISSSDDSNLIIPEGLLKHSLNLMGVVHYTDGSNIRYPVDGNRFELLYVDRAQNAVAGSKGSLILKYILGAGEKSTDVTKNGNEYFVTRKYNYTIAERDGSYSVKLYPVPIWVNPETGYRLDWYMFSLDRNQWYNVTNQVYINQNSPTQRLDGKLYGPLQQLNVSIDLGSINRTFRNYVHPQQVDIRFIRPANDSSGDKWLLGFDAYQNPPYGGNLRAIVTRSNVNFSTINISNNFSTQRDWLDGIYRRTLPLHRVSKEAEAPEPNRFAIITKDGSRSDYPIRMWNTELPSQYSPQETETVLVLFYRKYNDNDLYLSIAPLSVTIT